MKSLLIASLLLSMAFAAMEDVQTETTTFIPLIDIQPDQVVTNIQQPYHVSTTISADRQDLESLDFSDGDSYSFGPSSSYEDQSSESYERRGPRRSFRGSRNQRRGQDSESSESYSGSYSSGSSDSSYASSDSYSGYSDDSSSSPSYGSYGSYDGSYEGSYDDSDYSGSDYSSDSSSDSSSSDSSDSDSSRGHGRFNHKGWRGQKKFGRKYGHHQEGKENHGQGQTEPRGPRGPKGPKGPIDPFKRQVFETLRNIGHTVQEWQNAETAEQKNQIRDQAIQQFSTLLPIVDEVQASTINMRFAQEFARPAPNPEQNEIRTQLHQVAVRIFTEWQQATEVTIKNQIREELIQQVSALFPQN